MSYSFSPYVSFPGTGVEAFQYYQTVFGGDLDLTMYADMPDAELPFTPPGDALAHAVLTNGSLSLSGGDDLSEQPRTPAEQGVTFMLYLDTVAEAEELIRALLETGASVEMSFEPAPWGGYFGQVQDRFGVLWAFSVDAG